MKTKLALFVMLIAALMLTSCGPAATPTAEATKAPEATQPPAPTAAPTQPPAAGEPEVCASDEYGCAKIEKGQTIKLGYAGPMTGDYAAFGTDMSQAMLVAVEQFGDVEGFKFELTAQDDLASPEGGAAVANKLIADPTFVAMAGHAFSGATAAAMPIYESAGVPMLSPSATNPPLTTMGSKVFNRNAFTDLDQAAAAADYLFNTLKFTKIAAIHDGGDYGQGLAALVRDDFVTLGGEVVDFQAITPGESDFTAVLSAVAAKSPQAIYFGGYNADGAVLVNQMAQSGLEGVVFFGCDGTFGQDFLDKTGANGEGAYSTTLVPPSTPEKDAFDATYLEKFGVAPGVLSAYTWNSFDAATALMTQVKAVAVLSGDTLYVPRGALVAAVRGLKDYKGIAGTITCKENGECNASGPVLYWIKDGVWAPVTK
jgi:branched-chain amino acid transport system substrate-binding protein